MKKIAFSLIYPLFLLQVCGLPFDAKTKRIFFTVLYDVVLIYVIVFICMQFSHTNGNLFYFAQNIEALGVFGQHFGKINCLLLYNIKLRTIVESTKEFWTVSGCVENLRSRMNYLQMGNVRLQKVFSFMGLANVSLAVISTMFDRPLPFGMWNLEHKGPLYKALLIAENIIVYPTAVATFAVDGIFLGLCVELLIQFRFLGYKVENLTTEDDKFVEVVKVYLKQQIFLLRLLKEVTVVYSLVLTVEYMSITPMICIDMYLVSESNDLNIFVKQGSLALACLMQLAFYTIPAEYVVNEALQFANALYNSKWYSVRDTKTWKILSFPIQNSQHAIEFSASRMMAVNAGAILKVMKVAYSACAVMRAMKK